MHTRADLFGYVFNLSSKILHFCKPLIFAALPPFIYYLKLVFPGCYRGLGFVKHTRFASKKIANNRSYQNRNSGNHNNLAAIFGGFYYLGQNKSR